MSGKCYLGEIFMKRRLVTFMFCILFLFLGCENQADNTTIEDQERKGDSEINVNRETSNKIDGEIEVYEFTEAVNKADLIAQIKIVDVVEETDEPSPKTIFRARRIENLKGSSNVNEIFVLQQGNSHSVFRNNPLFKKDENYLLFLMKTTDLDMEDSYWILGEETGMYQLLDESIAVKRAVKDDELKKLEIVDKKILSFVEKNTELSLDGREMQVLQQDELKKIIKDLSRSEK